MWKTIFTMGEINFIVLYGAVMQIWYRAFHFFHIHLLPGLFWSQNQFCLMSRSKSLMIVRVR